MKDIESTRTVQSRVYRIRGQQVMLSPDLASLYGVKTKVLLQAARRNKERFPSDFMFQVSDLELKMCMISRSRIVTLNEQSLRSQFVTLNMRGKHSKYLPFAFTEHGIAMLSSVLRSARAIQINIAIIRTFIKLRHALLSNRDLIRRVEKIEGNVNMHETDIRLLVQDVAKLKKKPGPEGPIYPAIV